MSKRRKGQTAPPAQGRRARTIVLGGVAIALAAVGAAAAWWLSGEPGAATAGTPRLVVDRREVDLGYRRFDEPARVVFTLTNAGNGLLRLSEVPRVKVAAGC